MRPCTRPPRALWHFGFRRIGPCPEPDRAALEEFYDATRGGGWANSQNWLEDGVPIHLWHGVMTNEDGFVTRLDLPNNGLSGELPPQLGDLSRLQGLLLNDNQLRGGIPPELGNLSDVKVLLLNNNNLRGEIPPELGDMDQMEELFLQNNNLSGEIPGELGQLSNLEQLNIFNNRLGGQIPSQLGNLENLRSLQLWGKRADRKHSVEASATWRG